MIDKFSQALALMREAFADAQAGAMVLGSSELAAEVDGAQKVINAASAVQCLRVAQYAGREEEQDATSAWVEVDHGIGHLGEFASDCFGPMLAMGPVAADRKVDAAITLAFKLPVTLAAMSAGDLDLWRATIIATELGEASPQSCAAVEALIHPAVLDEAPGFVTRRVRRALGRVDADALKLKVAKERLDRFVHTFPSHVPGLTTWAASLPAADSAACWAAIDDLAHRRRGDDPAQTLEQCRADAFVDLILTNVEVATTITLMIPVQTVTIDEPPGSLERDLIASGQPTPTTPKILNPLASTDDFGQPTPEPNPFTEPTWQQICAMGYEIPGIGVISGDIVAAILDKFDTRIARILLDEHTGTVIETSTNTYLPSQAMRRFIQQRDRTCRFPGCARNAKRCETDHVTPHSQGGPTAIWNLTSLCKHHHRVKHQAGWTLTMTRDGTCTWTDPHGRQYATHPTNHQELAA